MIRINLVPQRRPRHADQGQQSVLVGVLAIIVVFALAYFLLDRPVGDQIAALEAEVGALHRQNEAKQKDLKDFKNLKEAVPKALDKNKTIQDLAKSRALPAHLMWELSNLLRPGGTPTITKQTLREMDVKGRQLNREWDATHVWITSLTEKNGDFTLTGGAQSDSDMTQLALRMQASVYFRDVVPEGGAAAVDKTSGITYYTFTITGKVVY